MTAEELILVVFHHARRRRIHVRESPLRIAVVNEILRVLDDVPQTRLARLESPLDTPAGLGTPGDLAGRSVGIQRLHGCAVPAVAGLRYLSYHATMRVSRSTRCA